MKTEIKEGFVYLLEGYTAPKVYTKGRFECLLTDQVIDGSVKTRMLLGHISESTIDIYRPERFANWIMKNYSIVKGRYRHRGDFYKNSKTKTVDQIYEEFKIENNDPS